MLFLGIAALWMVASSRFVDRAVNHWTYQLLRRYTKLEIRDYANLMHLSGDYGINEVAVAKGGWLADKTLAQLQLTAEGVVVLGIQRADGGYIGAPTAQTVAQAGDTLIVYGRANRLTELDQRRADLQGQLRHMEAVAEQQVWILEEQAEDVGSDDAKRSQAEAALQEARTRRDALREHAERIRSGVDPASDSQPGVPMDVDLDRPVTPPQDPFAPR